MPIGSSTRISRRESPGCARSAGAYRASSEPATPVAAVPMNPRRGRCRRHQPLAISLSHSRPHAEREHGLRLITFAGTQNRRRETRMVGRVGEVLRLQAEARCAACRRGPTCPSACRPGSCRCRTARPARSWRRRACVRSSAPRPRRVPQLTAALPVQHPVVVVAAAVLHLRIDRRRCARRSRSGCRKSNGVPSTGASSPVGISVASTGVKRSASSVSW